MRRTRRLLTVVVALAVLALGAAVLWWSVSGTQIAWQPIGSPDEQTLELSYVGSSCADQTSVKVAETDDTVTVTITERTFRLTCTDIAVDRTAKVDLDAPLEGRTLVDGSCTEPCARTLD
ncbi:MAG TPA: hypothetical protein VNZ66_01965 [Aeromicrobium sp.]|nr:hypothetical protein [Aeromicrobium sp.]